MDASCQALVNGGSFYRSAFSFVILLILLQCNNIRVHILGATLEHVSESLTVRCLVKVFDMADYYAYLIDIQ